MPLNNRENEWNRIIIRMIRIIIPEADPYFSIVRLHLSLSPLDQRRGWRRRGWRSRWGAREDESSKISDRRWCSRTKVDLPIASMKNTITAMVVSSDEISDEHWFVVAGVCHSRGDGDQEERDRDREEEYGKVGRGERDWRGERERKIEKGKREKKKTQG